MKKLLIAAAFYAGFATIAAQTATPNDKDQKTWYHKDYATTKVYGVNTENAYKFFPDLVNDKVYSCIETHMFPLNVMPPKYPEGWVVTLMDKKLSANVIKEIKYIPGIIKEKINK